MNIFTGHRPKCLIFLCVLSGMLLSGCGTLPVTYTESYSTSYDTGTPYYDDTSVYYYNQNNWYSRSGRDYGHRYKKPRGHNAKAPKKHRNKPTPILKPVWFHKLPSKPKPKKEHHNKPTPIFKPPAIKPKPRKSPTVFKSTGVHSLTRRK